MQAYKKEALEQYFLIAEAKALYAAKFITKEQLSNTTKALLLVKTNGNLLIRVAFFLLGSLLYSSIAGAFAVMILSNNSENVLNGLLFFYAIVGLMGSELLAHNQYFRHGLDDAFILGFQLCFCIAIGAATQTTLGGLIAMIVVGAFCAIRYLHTLSVLVFCIGILSVLFNLCVEEGLVDTVFLPFIGFFMALSFYFLATKILQLKRLYFYEEIATLMKLFSLVLGYFSMNYMVVRELSQNLMNLEITVGKDIPFAFLFYGFTFLIPVFYMIFGIYKKQRLFLWVGLFALGYSIFTIRYYYSLMPIEYALLIGGIVLFGISFLGIQFWKNKTEGITFQPDRSSDSKLLRNAQMLIITSQTQIDIPVSQDNMPFGGGGFSGGGAGESF
jgi:hypothetical protein